MNHVKKSNTYFTILITENEEIASYLKPKSEGKTHEEFREEALRLHFLKNPCSGVIL